MEGRGGRRGTDDSARRKKKRKVWGHEHAESVGGGREDKGRHKKSVGKAEAAGEAEQEGRCHGP